MQVHEGVTETRWWNFTNPELSALNTMGDFGSSDLSAVWEIARKLGRKWKR